MLVLTCPAICGVGCGGTAAPSLTSGVNALVTTSDSIAVFVAPDYQAILPTDYRVKETVDSSLFGSGSREQVVVSESPVLEEGYSGDNVQVVSWDAVAKRWNVIFDAQKVKAWDTDSTDTIDPGVVLPEGSSLRRMQLVDLGPEPVKALVFVVDIPAADGQSALAIVLFSKSGARLDYYLDAGGSLDFKVMGNAPNQTSDR